MTLNPTLEALRQALTAELQDLPEWKRDALRRDEEFTSQRNQSNTQPVQCPNDEQ
jgi:hypothetical protein